MSLGCWLLEILCSPLFLLQICGAHALVPPSSPSLETSMREREALFSPFWRGVYKQGQYETLKIRYSISSSVAGKGEMFSAPRRSWFPLAWCQIP